MAFRVPGTDKPNHKPESGGASLRPRYGQSPSSGKSLNREGPEFGVGFEPEALEALSSKMTLLLCLSSNLTYWSHGLSSGLK